MATLEPVVLCKYSRGPGVGKSPDDIQAFAGCGLFLAQPGALRTAESIVAIDISSRTMPTMYWEDLPGIIAQAGEIGYRAVVVDDGSLIFGNTFARCNDPVESPFALYKNDKHIGFDRGMWSYFRRIMNDVAKAMRWAGVHVTINCHEQDAFTDDDGATYPIGPSFAWKKLVTTIPFMVDVCWRCADRPPGVPSWDTRVDCDSSINRKVYMKDRLNGTPPYSAPMNTGEYLRSKGFDLPRPVGLEWIEDWAEAVAVAIVDHCRVEGIGWHDETAVGSLATATGFGATTTGAPVAKADSWELRRHAAETTARAALKAQLESTNGLHPYHIRWALRDGTHRARFRIYQTDSVLDGF